LRQRFGFPKRLPAPLDVPDKLADLGSGSQCAGQTDYPGPVAKAPQCLLNVFDRPLLVALGEAHQATISKYVAETSSVADLAVESGGPVQSGPTLCIASEDQGIARQGAFDIRLAKLITVFSVDDGCFLVRIVGDGIVAQPCLKMSEFQQIVGAGMR